MKVSAKVEYGLIALADIAIYSENNTIVPASDIAEREEISQKYLEQILVNLKLAGFIVSHKGSGGGYALSRSADSINMCEVLSALDDSILADNCPDDSKSGLRQQVYICFWDKINSKLREFAEGVTLSDFISECRHTEANWDMYVI